MFIIHVMRYMILLTKALDFLEVKIVNVVVDVVHVYIQVRSYMFIGHE